MSGTATRRFLLACVVLVQAGATFASAHAYTLTDWMRSWPTYYPYTAPMAPVAFPAAAPPTVVLPPSAAHATAPAFVAPAMPAQPPAQIPPALGCAAAPVPTCESRGVPVHAPPAFAPAPVAAAAPAHHCCVPWLAPLCRLFHHHHHRHHQRPQTQYRTSWVPVPTTNYRPVVSYHPLTGAATSSVQPCTTYTWQVQRVPQSGFFAPAQHAGSGWPAATAGPQVAPAAPTPYYPTPALAPSAPPLPAAPMLPPPVPDLRPTPPAAPGTGWGVPGAADQVPQLTPDEAQRLQEMQRVPSTSHQPQIPLSDPADDLGQRGDAPARTQGVTPVPDPDRRSEGTAIPVSPSRFDPRDRTAQQLFRPAAAVVPIVWPDSGRSAARAPTPVETPAAIKPPSPLPDSGGWRVVRP